MKLLLKVVIFLAVAQSQMAFAELGKSKVVKGDSAMHIRLDETCQYEKLNKSLQKDADWHCYYFAGFKTHATKIDVLKAWEAFPPYCAQDGHCGHRHQCILSWQATCEEAPSAGN